MENKADIIITNVQVYNSYFKEFHIADVSILDGKILYIDKKQRKEILAEKSIDGTGKYMIPGFVDIHMHIESSMMVPREFCKRVAACGVTTIVSEPHEMANVNGMKGILDMIAAGENCAIDIFYGIPSCVPSTSDKLETTGGTIDQHAMQLLMQNEKIICVGEIMNYRQIIKDDSLEVGKFLRELKAKNSKLVIEGHCPDLVDLDLAKFLYLGIDGDHTEHTLEQFRQRFENGMYVELQEKMLSNEVLEFIKSNNLYEYFGFVTDDVMADTLYEEGQLDRVVKKAIQLGMKPEQAIYNATYTNARRMNLLDRGVLAPGKKADFLLVHQLESLEIIATYKNGTCIYSVDHAEEEIQCSVVERSFDESYYHSIRVAPLSIEDFEVPVTTTQDAVEVRAMEVCNGTTKTKEKRLKITVCDGTLQWEKSECRLAMVIERYGKNAGNAIGYGLVCGDTIQTGAVATSYAHDSHNLLVVGATKSEMQMAVNRVIELQGAMVMVSNDSITAELPLVVGGILSEEPIKEIGTKLKEVRAAMIEQGYYHTNPIMSLCTLTLPVSPALKLTDKGLIDVAKGEIVPMIIGDL